jgi:hypothetical protein
MYHSGICQAGGESGVRVSVFGRADAVFVVGEGPVPSRGAQRHNRGRWCLLSAWRPMGGHRSMGHKLRSKRACQGRVWGRFRVADTTSAPSRHGRVGRSPPGGPADRWRRPRGRPSPAPKSGLDRHEMTLTCDPSTCALPSAARPITTAADPGCGPSDHGRAQVPPLPKTLTGTLGRAPPEGTVTERPQRLRVHLADEATRWQKRAPVRRGGETENPTTSRTGQVGDDPDLLGTVFGAIATRLHARDTPRNAQGSRQNRRSADSLSVQLRGTSRGPGAHRTADVPCPSVAGPAVARRSASRRMQIVSRRAATVSDESALGHGRAASPIGPKTAAPRFWHRGRCR